MPSQEDEIDPLLPIGAAFFAVFGVYVIAYALNSAAVDRYAAGFLLHGCPVCQEGHLTLEERTYRVLGIPRVRRTVRCDHCRSVLREVGRRRWRYTVDPYANPSLFDQLNNKTLLEAELTALAKDGGDSKPQYVDEGD